MLPKKREKVLSPDIIKPDNKYANVPVCVSGLTEMERILFSKVGPGSVWWTDEKADPTTGLQKLTRLKPVYGYYSRRDEDYLQAFCRD